MFVMTRYSGSLLGDICLVSLALITAALISLQWAGFIDWPWGLILAPVWVTVLLYFFAFAMIGFVSWHEGRG